MYVEQGVGLPHGCLQAEYVRVLRHDDAVVCLRSRPSCAGYTLQAQQVG